MARTVSVVITDDMDGSPDAETVTFGLNGVTYEIDLAEANRAKLSGAFAPFIAAGRRSSRGGRRRGAGRPGGAGVGPGGRFGRLRARSDQRRDHAAVRGCPLIRLETSSRPRGQVST